MRAIRLLHHTTTIAVCKCYSDFLGPDCCPLQGWNEQLLAGGAAAHTLAQPNSHISDAGVSELPTDATLMVSYLGHVRAVSVSRPGSCGKGVLGPVQDVQVMRMGNPFAHRGGLLCCGRDWQLWGCTGAELFFMQRPGVGGMRGLWLRASANTQSRCSSHGKEQGKRAKL